MPKRSKKSKNNPSHSQPRETSSRQVTDGPFALTVAASLAFCICIVYLRAIQTPFIFDDKAAIETNQSLTSLWPLIGSAEHPGPLNPPKGLPTAGRPLVN